MKALILAAGIASRLRPLTDSMPKCMLEVGGISIVERMINNLVASGITDIIIVTGYLADKLKNFISLKFPEQNISYVHNPVYDSTNNIYSLWLARDLVVHSDLLLMDSDIIIDTRILDIVINAEYSDCLALRATGHIGDEEMKVTTDSEMRVKEIAKTIPTETAAGESIGIEKFSPSFLHELFLILENLIVHQNQVDKFYELAFQIAIDSGQSLYACDVGDLKCIEVDTPADMQLADELARDLT